MRLLKTILGLMPALAGLLAFAPAFATPPSNCDTDSEAAVALVYDGATSINATLRRAVASLCIFDADGDGTFGVESEGGAPGAPNADFVERIVGSNQSFLCRMDLNGDGTAETCVAYYIHNQNGSCEGVADLDSNGTASAVVRISDGSTVPSGTIPDPSAGKAGTTCAVGKIMNAEHNGSDVSVDNCLPPPAHNDFVENRLAVEPFTYIVNQHLSQYLSPGYPIKNVSLNDEVVRSIWGTRDTCDWQTVDGHVTTPVAISAVKRNPLSGTRRSNDKTVLKNVIVSPDIIEAAGTGNVITAVNNNSVPSPFNCAIAGAPTVTTGYIGVDKFNINNNGTPGDESDDYPVRASGTGNCDAGGDCYEAIGYNGPVFNPYRTRCGQYEYWTYMRFHRRSGQICDPAKATVMTKVENAFKAQAGQDKALIDLSSMVVKRDVDGGIIKPIPGATQCAP